MKKIRIGVLIVAVIVIIDQLAIIDYTTKNWRDNLGSYLSIISMVLLSIAMIYSDKKNRFAI